MTNSFYKALFAVAVTMAVLGGAAGAQTVTGSVTGTVSDPSGAAIAGARVRPGVAEQTTDADATPGRYNLAVWAAMR